MNDDSLRRVYGKTLDKSAANTSRATCPPPERLADLVDGAVPEAERMTMLAHVSSCAHCLREYEMLRSLKAGAEEMAPRRWMQAPMLRAAVIVLGVGVGALAVNIFMKGRADVERGGSERVSLVSPAGQVPAASPLVFTWRAVAGASSYRVEVLDGADLPHYSASTTDTTYMVPDSVHLAAGTSYTWWVRAQLRDGGERRSQLAKFEIYSR
jgi:hypothetical protein